MTYISLTCERTLQRKRSKYLASEMRGNRLMITSGMVSGWGHGKLHKSNEVMKHLSRSAKENL